MTVVIFEGPDNLGKSTIIDSLIRDYKNVRDIYMMHSTGPHCKEGEDPFEYQKNVFYSKVKKMIALNDTNKVSEVKSDDIIIMDRSWIGEYVYGQLYRDGDDKKILDMINTCNIMLMSNNISCVFIQLDASPEFIISKDDNKSFTSSYDKDKRLSTVKHEIKLFNEVFDKMWIDEKTMTKFKVNVQYNKKGYRVLSELNEEIKRHILETDIRL